MFPNSPKYPVRTITSPNKTEDVFSRYMRFLVIITLLDNPRRDLKEKWFSLWCQIRSSLSCCPQSSLVNHRLAMSSHMSSSPTASLSTPSNLVRIWDGLLFGFSRSYPAYKILSWPKIRIFQVSTHAASLVRSYRVENLGGSDPIWYLTMSPGDR